jgi:hypothetical protein
MRIVRTWPYGTTRKANVMSVVKGEAGPIYVVLDDRNEAHVLIGQVIEPNPRPGTDGTLTFVQGGPTGGYWKFEPNQKTK